jgi:hypothetical protein
MRMEVFKARLLRPSPEHLADAVVCHNATTTQPQLRVTGETVFTSLP